MRRLLVISFLALAGFLPASAQTDSASVAKVLSMVDGYVLAIEAESLDQKALETDFLISTCTEDDLRKAVALKLFDHYCDSKLMGEEAVAIHIFDNWFADGKVPMRDEVELLNARIFADFNRSSLLGMPAPVVEMTGMEGEPVTVPGANGRQSVLYFYDAECPKCRLESIMLRTWLEEQERPLDFYAIYLGTDHDAWTEYVSEKLSVTSNVVSIHHCWDPEVASDYQRLYGILQRPKLFLVDSRGIITGRRLTVDALDQLVSTGAVDEELLGRNPLGSKLPAIKADGVWRRGNRTKVRTMDLSRLKGKPAYLVFYSESCTRCQEQMAAVDKVVAGGATVFLVNVDETMAGKPELARKLLDSFDLSILPHIISLDKKALVTDKYISFE